MLDKIIKSRRSIRKFKSKKPDWRVILDCIDSVRYAPMAGDNFSLKFVLVDDLEKISEISKACEQDFVADAKYVVVVCSDEKRTKVAYGDERGKKYLRQQAGAGIQNFLLEIADRGLATCWVGHFYDDKIKRILKIPEDVEVEALFPIGYAFEKPKKKELVNFDNIMYFNEYKKKQMNAGKKLDV